MPISRRAVIALGLLLAVASPAAAGPFEEAVAAHKLYDYATALTLLKPLAEQGDAEAQRLLGFMYEIGHGVPQNYFEAVAWYGKAVAQGNANARVRLARVTARQQAFKAADDAHELYGYETALPMLRPLADQGYAEAQKLLGYMYEFGQGVQQDYERAAAWYRKAAAKGNPYARVRLKNLTTRQLVAPN